MVMLLAFGGAGFADARAIFEHFLQDRFVRPGAAKPKAGSRLTDVGAVHARPHALAHVLFLRRAGVGTGQAHL